jgi:hypothetical protein
LAKRILTVVSLSVIGLLAPSNAHAQLVPLSQLLVDLIQGEIFLAPPPPGPFTSHEAHFVPGANQELAPALFNQQLIAQIGTFPLGSPSGGFSYEFDSSTGTFRRATESFGPAFAERALTIGRNRFSVGVNFQYSKYNSFEGADLETGEIKFYLTHQPITTPPQFFEGDVIEAALNLDVSSTTTTLYANYGLTNAWDVAVAVPIQTVSMDASVDATVLRLATGTTPIHQFRNGTTQDTFTSSGDASGIGDMIVRTKYRFLDLGGGGLAAGLDVRLPTGDEANLLGTGATQTAFTFIASSTRGKFAPHFNLGYTWSGESDIVSLSDEFGYRVGAEYIASPALTLSADLVGRTLMDADRLEFGDVTFNYMNALGTPGSSTFTELGVTDNSLNLTSLAVGGKFNVSGSLLINANVLFGLGSSGLTATFTPVIGVDYSF